MFKQPFSSLGLPCHQRATTRIGNAKAQWTTAVSTPGPLTVLEAAGLTGLWMVYESRTVA